MMMVMMMMTSFVICIRFEARLLPNIGFALRRVLAVFTHSAITPPKINRFGLNLGHSEYVVGDWTWQILVAIRAVDLLSGKQRTISPISRRPNFT